MNYLIIGNSAAAIGCVEGIRQQDKEGSITLVSAEPHHCYSRPLISYLLKGKTDEARMRYRPADFYEKHGVKALLGSKVTAIDPAAHTATLADGTALHYDKLLVATGSSPFLPPTEGYEQVEHKTTFLTLDDARYLQKTVTPATRVLIVGAGLIGLKCAEGLSRITPSVTVVDLAPQILPSILDKDGAALIQSHIETHGIRFLLGDSVARFEGDRAHLTGGGTLPFDLLVMAVGVRPNVSLVREAGGQVDRGIPVDEHARTSLPDVYAAGDCTECFDVAGGTRRVLALLPNAYLQGEAAGVRMAGGAHPFDKAIPMNAIGFFGKHMITAGAYEGELYETAGEGNLKRLFYKDGLLKGYMLIGEVARAGIYTALIRERTPLAEIDFDLIKEKPQLMAFSRPERGRILGGVGA